MKITDMLDSYPEHTVPLPEVSAPSPERTKELTMNKIKASRKKSHRFPRKALMIAAVVALFSLSAFAAGFTLWERARQDLGLIDVDIPEYTEYSIDENDQPTEITFQNEEAENAMGQYVVPDAKIDLISTLCTGNEITAYLAISPVTQEMADLTWPEAQGLYDMADWSFGIANVDFPSLSYLCTQLEYDPDTETALVRLYMKAEGLAEATELTLSMSWWSQTGETDPVNTIRYYGDVTIPVTPSTGLATPVTMSLENSSLPQFSGSITNLEVQAGYISVTVEAPSFYDACATLGQDAFSTIVHSNNGDSDSLEAATELDAATCYSRSWTTTVDQALSDATLTLQDGTSLTISQLENPNSCWRDTTENLDVDYFETSTFLFQYDLSTPLDLSQIQSITIGGTQYPLA